MPGQVQLVRLSEMTPNAVTQKHDDTRTINFALAGHRPEVEEKSVDLISVTSDDYNQDDDQVSFDEGRLQQWNFPEFQMQLLGAIAGMMVLFGCGLISAWAITDFIKDVQQNEAEWVDMDYSFELFDNDDDELLASRHVIIAMVVLSYNVGCIVGGICGAFITPLLPNRIIYTLGSMCMLLTGISLTTHTSAFYCAKSRLVTGFVVGLVQLTLIVQAAESTTKKVRRWMLIVVAYINAVSNLLSTGIFYYYDDREQITYTEDNSALYIVSWAMIGCAIVSLILNFIFTHDTIPFHLVREEETKAFKEMSRLKTDYLSMLDIRYEFERIRFDVTQSQLEANRSLAARSNHVPLISMCCVRILNLLFTSVPITLVFIWDPATSTKKDVEYDLEERHSMNTTPEPGEENLYISPLLTLATLQGFRMLCSIAVILRQDKYHFNRFCYRLAGFCGFTLLVWFVARVIFSSVSIIQEILYFPVSIVTMMAFTGLPIPLDIIQLNQSADSYTRIKNTWSLACAIFVENIIHIFLIIQLDMIFGVMFVFLVNGVSMLFFSYWLMKNMPNVVSIHPIAVAIVARYPFKHTPDERTMHI